MLFEKFVEQHRVHVVVAHTVGFSLRTTRSEFTFSTSSATNFAAVASAATEGA